MKTTKNQRVSLDRKRVVFFEIGMIVSLALVLAAFEWKSSYEVESIKVSNEIPTIGYVGKATKPEPPKKQPKEKKKATEINIIDEKPDLGIEEMEIFFGGDEGTDPTTFHGKVEVSDKSNKEEDFVTFTSDMPAFPGGEAARHKYLRSNIEYPMIARKTTIAGTVYVEFIVEKDGTISNVRVLRGPHESLNKEALRVVRNMPAWEPGRQGIKKVRVQMVMPVKFKLK